MTSRSSRSSRRVAPGTQCLVQQRMGGESAIDDLSLHVHRQVTTQWLEVSRHHEADQSRAASFVTDACFGRCGIGPQTHRIAFVGERRITHLLAVAGARFMSLGQIAESPAALAGGQL